MFAWSLLECGMGRVCAHGNLKRAEGIGLQCLKVTRCTGHMSMVGEEQTWCCALTWCPEDWHEQFTDFLLPQLSLSGGCIAWAIWY